MLRRIFCSIVLLCVSTLVLAATPADELTQYLNGYKTYQADFTQMTYMGDNRPQKTSGRVMMMRPGKFRWETNRPMKQLVIANGKILWIYDVDLQQATRQKISGQGATNPAALLTGDAAKVIKRYHIKTITLSGSLWYRLTPKSKGGSFTLVQMRFQENKLVAMWVKNNLGQSSLFRFKNVKLNAPLSPKLFIFKPPHGVSVLTQ